MNARRYLAYRVVWTLVGVWAALTTIFFAYAMTPDPDKYLLGGPKDSYRVLRRLNAELLDRYLTWFGKLATLDLGTTAQGEPILGATVDAAAVTLTYLVPSIALAVVVGVVVGLFAAIRRTNPLVRAVRGVSYGGFAIPTLVAAETMFVVAKQHLNWFEPTYDPKLDLLASHNLLALSLPAVVVTLNVVAVQFRYAHAESTEIVEADFVRTLRASGASTVELVKHLFRNAAGSLLTLFVSEMVSILFVVIVVVEVIFGVPGFGTLLYEAVRRQDLGLIFVVSTLPIVLVMVGNLLQDVAHALIDPRITSE